MVSFILYYAYRVALASVGVFLSVSYLMSIFYMHITEPILSNMYDYIIVGGGTAGAVIAGRLARDQGMSVLLLEAGPSPPLWGLMGLINVPLGGPIWQQSEIDWSYATSPQDEACGGLRDRVSIWPRGRILGGSSHLNNMVYLRGHFYDWDEWEKSCGSEWGRKSMLHYLRKSERQYGSYINDSVYHKLSGWLPVTDSPLTALGNAVLEGVRQLGLPVRDLNGAHQEGFMRAQITALHGSRFTPDRAFLNSDLHHLRIFTHSIVDKVLFNEKTEAYGVEFRRGGSTFRAKSRHGVVLSAGAIGSPTILMRSGIGPAQLLHSFKIPMKVNLPVGENLQDHLSTGLDLVLINTSLAMNLARAFNPKAAYDYMMHGKGPWTHGGCEVVGVWRSTRINESDPPDLEMMVLPAGVASDGGALLRHNLGISDKVWKGYFESLTRRTDVTSVTLAISLLHPLSRGSLSIASTDPEDPPIIDPNYLQESEDVETLIEGLEIIKRLLRTRAMAELGASINTRKIPGCKALPFFSRRYWDCYIRMLTLTSYHPAGTCRMGKKEDASTVVDSSLRVHGTQKLYVADASIMPTLPSGNPMAAVIAIAEKMADILQKGRETDMDCNIKRFIDEEEEVPPTCKRTFSQPSEGRSDEL